MTKGEIKEIAENMLKNLAKRLKNLNINLEFDGLAVQAIADAGFDEVYGARPLRRAIQSKIEDSLSEKILERELKNGDNVLCTHDGENFVFKPL